MAIVIRVCGKCGAKIFSDAPEGLCTGCALESALGVLPNPVAANLDCNSDEYSQGSNASPEPHVGTTPRLAKMLGELGDYELL